MTFNHAEIFGGVPFTEDAFRPSLLLAAVSVVRRRQAERGQVDISAGTDIFDPVVATRVRNTHVRQDLPSAEVTPDQEIAIGRVLNLLRDTFPAWQPLLDIPIRFKRLVDSPAISASSFAWPQHIFLGDDAFETDSQLAEQIMHEFCHCWLYFLDEVSPIGDREHGRNLVLPSGTSNRDAAEALGALHVAVCLQVVWAHLDVSFEGKQQRIHDLERYADGCAELLHTKGGLTAGGWSLARRLHPDLADRGTVLAR